METQTPNVALRRSILISAAIVALMAAASAWAALWLPDSEECPVHWNAAGQPDGFAPKWMVLGMAPGIAAVLSVLFAVMPRFEPRVEHLRNSMKAYCATWLGALLLMLALHAMLIAAAFGHSFSVPRVTGVVLGLLFIVMGNYMGKTRSSLLFGIRNRFTLTSDLAWNKTHRLSGKLMVALGLVMAGTGLFGSWLALLWIFLAVPVPLLCVVSYYSYMVWQQDPNRVQRLGEDENRLVAIRVVLFRIAVYVGIPLWLASLAVPQVASADRNKVSRARADMRYCAMALESYYTDHRCYPTTGALAQYALNPIQPFGDEKRVPLSDSHADTMPSFGTFALTTPVARMNQFFTDPFAPQKGMPFAYDCTESGWIMISPGPDRVYDIVPAPILRGIPGTTETRLLRLTYDATNGIASRGDIWRMKQ